MKNQIYWYPGQPNNRVVLDFSSDMLEIDQMPPSFIYEDESFYGNVYSNSDLSKSYSIIGRNVLDKYYKEISGSENILTNVVPEVANCMFVPNIESEIVSLILINENNAIVKYDISENAISSKTNIITKDSPVPNSPIYSYIHNNKLYLGYVSSLMCDGKFEYYLIVGVLENSSFNPTRKIYFSTFDNPENIYINLGSLNYSVTAFYKEQNYSVIQIGTLSDGILSDIKDTVICQGEIITPAFDINCKYIMFAETVNGNSTVNYYDLKSMTLHKKSVLENYNMLKLGADKIIYGINGGKVNYGSKFMLTVIFNEDVPPDILESYSSFSGGYLPAESCIEI